MNMLRVAALSSGVFAALLVLSACSDTGPQGDRPAPAVGFVTVAPSAVPVSVTLSGRTVAFETSEVRPQVSGIIRRRLFTEGSTVRAGQPLYEIDPSLYRASVHQAEANLAQARASARVRRLDTGGAQAFVAKSVSLAPTLITKLKN